MRYNNVSAPKVRTTVYGNFKGADFSTDPSQVDESHSPMPLNLIADEGGFPEKRLGWRTLKTLSGQINGIFSLVANEKRYLLIHHGKIISHYDAETDTVTDLKSGIADARSTSFLMNGAVYLLTGKEYLVISANDGALSCENVSERAYLPRTVISRSPSGGGESFEAVNLLNPKRQNDF
ncbi:MAG: hypothetical protein J6C75_02035 [Oscillospiraceae bacterium]|nr:hypothetical protein [Oscillospiraceae bacterium]